MKAYIISLLGQYAPSGDTFAGADWPFIISGIILVISTYFIFKALLYIVHK